MIYITQNIFLRPLSLGDAVSLFRVIDDERETLCQWLPFVDLTEKIQDTQNYIEQSLIMSDVPQFCIYEGDCLIGLVGFKDYDPDNRRIEIGYWLSKDAEGRGIMTQSVRRLLELAFTNLNINRVQIRAAVENHKSRKIAERLGFFLEGVEREGELLANGFTDLALYSLLKREYINNIESEKIK